jgi:WD40 repeat protein
METFEITIQRHVEEAWPIIAEQSAGGMLMPVRAEGSLHLDTGALASVETEAHVYGELLGQALFQASVRDAFVEALARCDERMRVLLFVEDPTLRGLRWERLCAPLDGKWEMLALNQRTPFSHYLPSLTDRRFPPIGRRDLRALILAADPPSLSKYGLAPFDAPAAIAGVRAALGPIPAAVLGPVEDAAGPPTLDALCERITAEHITLLHMVCHGRVVSSGETVIYLAKSEDTDAVDPVTATRLIERLGALQGARGLPHFTFLSTCDSASATAELALGGLAHRLVRELGMPSVIAMTEPVTVATANALAQGVYQRLREHGEVDRALVEATATLAERRDITIAALYSRLGGRPLFSDTAERPLTSAEIGDGLAALEQLLSERAPVLQDEFAQAATRLRGTLNAEREQLSLAARQERDMALEQIATICLEAADLSFAALALGQAPPRYDARCPFPGLTSFRAEDREFFFGRSALIEQLARRLDEHSFLAVLGPSGSGKSSLVRAGLVPVLQKRMPDLALVYLTPGSSPPAQFEAALAQATRADAIEIAVGDAAPAAPARPTLIVVDQFEEVFTLCADAKERQAFFDRLLGLPDQQRVVITMRADFWGECAPYPKLKERMQAHQELIAPMNANELRQVMELQAAAVGLRFEADLGANILDDVQGEPGAMPLLQHALQELWQRRRGRWLRIVEYRAIGGIQQAIAHTADSIYVHSSQEDKERLRDIFVRLTRLDQDGGEEQRDTRQRVALAELVPADGDPAPIRELVRRLADSRLLVTSVNAATGEEQVEVAHEALIRSWPRLRVWLNEDRAGLRMREALRQRARDWEASGHDESLLFRGNQLDRAEELSRQARFAPNKLERAFLDTALEACERERRAEEERQRRELEAAQKLAAEQQQRAEAERQKAEAERRRAEEQASAAQRLKQRAIFLAGVAVVAVVAMIAAAFLGWQAEQQRVTAVAEKLRADSNAAEAKDNEAQAKANEALAQRNAADAMHRTMVADAQAALSGNNTDQALALAQAAASLDPPVQEARLVLAEAAFRPGARLNFTRHISEVNSVAFSPDGRQAASASDDSTILVWNPADGQVIRTLKVDPPAEVLSVAFSPDGRSILAGGGDGNVWLWDVGSGRHFATEGHTAMVWSVAFSRDGRRAISGDADGAIVVWDVASGQPYREWNVTAGLPPDEQPAEGESITVFGVTFSPDGSHVLSGSQDGSVILWDVEDGKPIRRFENAPEDHWSAVYSVAFSPNLEDHQAISGADDGAIVVWNVDDGKVIQRLTGHTEAVYSVAFSPDGDWAVSGSVDHTVRLWDLAGGQELWSFAGHSGAVNSVAFSPDGGQILSGSADRSARLWDLAGGQAGHGFQVSAQPILSAALSADGHTAVVGLADGALLLWNVDDSQVIGRLQSDSSAPVLGVALSPDGKQALSGSDDQTVRLWDLASGRELRSFAGHTDWVRSVAFSPDGSKVLSGANDGMLILWNLADGKRIGQPLTGHAGPVTGVALSKDGTQALSGSEDGTLILWNLADGRAIRSFKGYTEAINAVALSPDGTRALSGSIDHTVRMWDVATGQEIVSFQHDDEVTSVAFSPDGQLAFSGSLDKTLRSWNLVTKQELARFEQSQGQQLSVAFSPDGSHILSSGADGSLLLWSADGQLMRGFNQQSGSVRSVAFSPNGTQALSGADDGTLRLWNLADGQAIGEPLTGHTDWVRSVAISPDGKWGLSGSNDHTIRLWDLINRTKAFTLTGHTDSVRAVAFSPDGKLALSGADDKTMRLWDLATHNEVRRFTGHTGAVLSVAFSPDGKLALSGSDDGKLILWNVADGKIIHSIPGHTGPVNSVVFSRDGAQALSGSGDGTVRLWNLEPVQEVLRFASVTGGMTGVAFNPRAADQAIASSTDGVLLSWQLGTTKDLIELVKRTRYVPPLTSEQRQYYRVDTPGAAAPSP